MMPYFLRVIENNIYVRIDDIYNSFFREQSDIRRENGAAGAFHTEGRLTNRRFHAIMISFYGYSTAE